MTDPEFREMVNKAIFVLAIVLVFSIPVFLVFKNKIMIKENAVIKEIKNSESILIYVTEDNCDMCKTIKKELKNKDIEYKELNRDKERDYKTIITKLGLDASNIYPPTLIYIEDGEVVSYIIDIKSKVTLNEYVENYK